MSPTKASPVAEAAPSSARDGLLSRLSATPGVRAYARALKELLGAKLRLEPPAGLPARESGGNAAAFRGSEALWRKLLLTDGEPVAIYRPPTGVSEVAVPVRLHGGLLVGYVVVEVKRTAIRRRHLDLIARLVEPFALHLASQAVTLAVSPNGVEPRIVLQARHFMEAHYSENVGLRGIAKAVGATPSHLSRQFRTYTRITVTNYLKILRVGHAKEMLRTPDCRISEAAFAAGFQSISQFGRAFHELVGETPKAYREREFGKLGLPVRPAA